MFFKRENKIKQITVEADMAGGDLAAGISKLRRTLAQMDKPTGYAFDFSGNAEMMAEMKDTVLAVLAFALFLMSCMYVAVSRGRPQLRGAQSS